MRPSETIRVIQTGKRRLKIFIDFWNVVIAARRQTKKLEIEVDWWRLATRILSETSDGYDDETTGALAGCYVFGSYVKSDPAQTKFVHRTIDEYGGQPGLFFNFAERIKKETSLKCSNCGHKNNQFSESGVDVVLSVEMIKHAMMREHEYLALVSGDRDFIPLLAYLKDQGQRVMHIAVDDNNREMRTISWKQFGIKKLYPEICSTVSDIVLIFTHSNLSKMTEAAEKLIKKRGLAYEIIDISDNSSINDVDLSFLIRCELIHFYKKINRPQHQPQFIYKDLSELRVGLRKGDIIANNLPLVKYNGHQIARAYNGSNWSVAQDEDSSEWNPPPIHDF